MLANTLYNLHLYIRKIEIIHVITVITFEWKFINTGNSCDFFFSEFEEMKSYIYRVETLYGSVMVLASSVHNAPWGNCTFYDQEILQKTIFDESFQSLTHARLAFCWVAYLLWQKCHCQELGFSQREKNFGTNTWVVEYDWLFTGKKHFPFQIFFPKTPSLSTATEDLRFPSTMSSVKCSRRKVKFSSSLTGSPTNSR